MKNFLKLVCISMLSMTIIYLSGCNDDDDGPKLTGDNKVFDLVALGTSTASGTVTFAKRDDNKTLITIQLSGAPATSTNHPAHIHSNTAAEGGDIVLSFEDVSASNGKSETVVSALDDGTPITYEQLIDFDGYVNVHASESDLATLIAQGDIGQNALTDDFKVYNLNSVTSPAINGTVKFEKRENNETLVTITTTGTTAGQTYHAHIHTNTVAQTGGIVIDLSDVDGTKGISKTNVSKLKDNTAITYAQLLDFNGYAQVHLPGGAPAANVDIGMNELTGTQKIYQMNAVGASGISGTVTFAQRKSGFTLVTIDLTGTADINRVAHIHSNSVAQTGPVVKDLNVVNGTTGKSYTHVTALNDDTPITYAQLLTFNGYAQAHIGPAGGTPVANGNIGSNAP